MTDGKLEHIPRRKLYHELVDRLLERLRAGEFDYDRRMPSEREIMETYGVGRPAVREALLAIDRMGLIAIVHGERARLVKPTAQSMMEQITSTVEHVLSTSPRHRGYLREARLFFETGMVRIAASKATPADLDVLSDLLRVQRESSVHLDAFGDVDMSFHREIARISGNAIFTAVSQAMSQWLQQYRRDLIQLPGAQDLTIAEHERIFDRIAAHDIEGAAEAMAIHLNRVDELYRRYETVLDTKRDGKRKSKS